MTQEQFKKAADYWNKKGSEVYATRSIKESC